MKDGTVNGRKPNLLVRRSIAQKTADRCSAASSTRCVCTPVGSARIIRVVNAHCSRVVGEHAPERRTQAKARDNTDRVTQTQVAQTQVAQTQVAQTQVAQTQVAQTQVAQTAGTAIKRT
jgi:hypothetical protein